MNAECARTNAKGRAARPQAASLRRSVAAPLRRSALSAPHSVLGTAGPMMRRPAFTLVEMLVVAGIIAIILGVAIASLRALTGGVQVGAARTMLRTVLASARAEAAARGHVVGVRFQQYQLPNVAGAARQAEEGATFGVIVFPAMETAAGQAAISELKSWVGATLAPLVDTYAACLFVAADGREPVRFPQGVEVARDLPYPNPKNQAEEDANNEALTTYLRTYTTFTVLFSPGGQVVIQRAFVVQRHNRDSVFYSGPDYPQLFPQGDPQYNPNFDPRPTDVVPLLLRDDRSYVNLLNPASWTDNPPGLLADKLSQSRLWLYDQNARKQAGAQPWTNYLKGQGKSVRILINPYTGQLEEPSGP